MATTKSAIKVHEPLGPVHWVGNGFPVRTLFTFERDSSLVDPFLLLDYAGPHEFRATETSLGVGAHPHRGFETVTIVYQGEIEHRDSAGHRGRLEPGDVQWMTAGKGIIHEERHSRDFAINGGTLELVQLWVNLPKQRKLSAPAHQDLRGASIPNVGLADDAGVARIIAGQHGEVQGPARTFTPINVWDVRLIERQRATFRVPSDHNVVVVVLGGSVMLDRGERVTGPKVALLGRDRGTLRIESLDDALLLILTGVPLHEPVAMSGPFVMNTRSEVLAAIADFRRGEMGRL